MCKGLHGRNYIHIKTFTYFSKFLDFVLILHSPNRIRKAKRCKWKPYMGISYDHVMRMWILSFKSIYGGVYRV